MYVPADLVAYNRRAFDSGWDGMSPLVYGSALPERDGGKVQKKREAVFELTPPRKPREEPAEKKRELEGWEWARIKKKNKKLKAMQTTLNFE